MRHFYFIILLLVNLPLLAQVGIGTEDPVATLDINGNLIIRSVDTISSGKSNISILVIDNSLKGNSEVKQIPITEFREESTSSAYSAVNDGNWSLLQLNILNRKWSKIDLTGEDDTKLGNQSLLKNGVYTAPKSGIYRIHFVIHLESGIELSVLGGKRLAVLKNNSVWEEKYFDAINVGIGSDLLGLNSIAQVPLTSTSIDTLIELEKGDKVQFVMSSALLNIGLLSDSKIALQAYKIAH
ncbi:hypothetical protein [Zunongwangia endophytica]|uniref:C1q domain-containing protein n=1 Tax=Zunongwangia endophytica TaxID=1808945 RepID=A0ABV8H279_9FLAO|nr:hypothetical protein [Zunongwangia endophytica]MDN3594475.1 hypothetical protein [Zunongwangia endophytica]